MRDYRRLQGDIRVSLRKGVKKKERYSKFISGLLCLKESNYRLISKFFFSPCSLRVTQIAVQHDP